MGDETGEIFTAQALSMDYQGPQGKWLLPSAVPPPPAQPCRSLNLPSAGAHSSPQAQSPTLGCPQPWGEHRPLRSIRHPNTVAHCRSSPRPTRRRCAGDPVASASPVPEPEDLASHWDKLVRPRTTRQAGDVRGPGSYHLLSQNL